MTSKLNITESTNPGIALTSIRGLELDNNTIEFPDNSLLVPWIMNSFGRNEDPSREVYMKNVIFESVGIQDSPYILSEQVRISPNPFTEQLRMNFFGPPGTPYTIVDMLGKKVFSSRTDSEVIIPVSSWIPGMYILLVEGNPPLKLLKR